MSTGVRMARRRRIIALMMVALGVLAGCRAPAAVTPGIAWEPCESDGDVVAGDAPSAGTRVLCGRLDVPLDPGDPAAGTVSLAVARLPARGVRAGTVVIDPGGPGSSGVDHLIRAGRSPAGLPFAGSHDLVAVDARGVGASRPSLRCRTDAERDAARAADTGDRSAAGIARIEHDHEELALRCRDRIGAAFLSRVGTDFAVDDLDRVRIALGEGRIGFVGHSYGTRTGIEYARRFPSHVDGVVLDGVVDPDGDPVDAALAQLGGFGRAFDAFAADCVRRAGCPLGSRADQAVQRYREMLAPLRVSPVAVGDRTLSQGDAETATVAALYRQSTWGRLRGALAGLARGEGSDLLALADSAEGRMPGGGYDATSDAFLAITCADDTRVADRARWDDYDARARRAAPFRDDGRGTGRGPRGICDHWTPAARPPGAALPVGGWRSDAPALVVVTAGDPATPYAAGIEWARENGAGVVTVRGQDHTAVFRGDPCVDDVVSRYLTDLRVPPGHLTC
ncbi:alpha/beta fold hydrolase [Gordonia sp. OPL2]|uniref:alpha/beta fold hydrolase n=1 Tax=Gordonia sp. OPL2 TaxID=2486274 RepID=UPI001655FFE3|nr:alpha/beta fold hydrolase [Gordonia sp. OPL2]